jgi:probable rRNA maturation factor
MTTGNSIEIRCENVEPPSWIASLREFIAAILAELNVSACEVSVLITDDPGMKDLNKRYRDIDEPTDVLSFGEDPPPRDGPLGDIVIDLPQVVRQAPEFAVSPEEELRRVTLHGILHLLGHEHQTRDFEREPMLQLQEDLLAKVEERLF